MGLTSKVSLDVLHPSFEKISPLIKISEKLGLVLRPTGLLIIVISSIWGIVVYSNSPLSVVQATSTTTATPITTTASATSTPLATPSISLIGVSYIADDWDPRVIDLRTVSTSDDPISEIPIKPGQSLQFFDLWVNVPPEASGYNIYADIFDSNGIKIGKTRGQKAEPGIMKLEDLNYMENFLHPAVKNAWQVQSDWSKFDIYVYLFDDANKLSTTSTTIKVNLQGTSWLIAPPYAHFISIDYSR